MKPGFEKVPEQPGQSFVVRTVERGSRPLLSQAWHYHPEIEICLTTKSNGRRFVGNQISDYQEDDLVMFGSNVPHGYTTDEYSRQVVIQLDAGFLGNAFINSPEMRSISTLFDQALHGLVFGGASKQKAIEVIHRLAVSDGVQRLITLLDLLRVLAESKETQRICSKEYALGFNVAHLGRIKIVYDHIMDNFKEEVRIKEIADKLNISEAAFYKFIKKHTKKTYTQIINEFRINYASKLLMNTDKTIAQICFECGYNNLSYFNRKFKEIMEETPQVFRGHYRNKV